MSEEPVLNSDESNYLLELRERRGHLRTEITTQISLLTLFSVSCVHKLFKKPILMFKYVNLQAKYCQTTHW